MREEPEEQRESGAKDEAGDNGEVESGVLAAVNDISGQAAETEGKFAAKVKKSAEDDKEDAKNEEHAAEFAEGIHGEHSSGTEGAGDGANEEIPPLRRPASAQRGRQKKPACSS